MDTYLSYPASKDEETRINGNKTLIDYYLDAKTSQYKMTNEKTGITNINKGIFTLSIFLNYMKIQNLILVGGSSHVCLASTVYSATERGFNVILPIDSIASEDHNKHWVFLHNFNIFNSTVCTTSYLIDCIRGV